MALALVFCTGWETPVIAGEPNHLVPVPAYDRSGYNEAVFESFLGGKSAQAWMIAQPSFAPEYAVLLRHIQTFAKNSPPFNPKVESDKWVVEHLEVRSKIWKWKELPGGGSDLDIKVTKDFFQSATEVPEDFAEKVMAAWSGVLRQTRYVETDGLGQDGEIFQFFCYLYHEIVKEFVSFFDFPTFQTGDMIHQKALIVL